MLDPATLTAVITATAVTLSKDRTSSENALIGALFTQLGDAITSIAVTQDFNDSRKSSPSPAPSSSPVPSLQSQSPVSINTAIRPS